MFTTRHIKELTVLNILERVSELDIFRYYFGTSIEIGKPMRSPLRRDENPSFSIYKTSYGAYKLRFIDYSTYEGGTCFDLVMRMYGCSFNEALMIVNKDFHLGLGADAKAVPVRERVPLVVEDIPERTVIQVQIRPWNATFDKDYWTSFGITGKTLQRYNVYPLAYFNLNGHQYKCIEPTYGYYFGDGRWKVYSPLAKTRSKWFSNTSRNIIQGWDQLPQTGELVVITKALKDVLVLAELGIPAIAPQSESILLSEEVIEQLKTRFQSIYVNFDFDLAGVKGANRYRKLYGLPVLFLTNGRFGSVDYQAKDVSDYVKRHGGDALKTLLGVNTDK